jgi:hypothetical protein
MPTLEMVRLRSVMPNSGLVTLRHPLPPLNPVIVPDLPIAGLDDAVADVADLDENDAEKGGDAR